MPFVARPLPEWNCAPCRVTLTIRGIGITITEDGMNRFKSVMLGVAFMALPAIARAQTQTINFDDLNTDRPPNPPNPAPSSVCPVPLLPNGYHGFNWDNFYVLKGSQYFDPYLIPPGNTYCIAPGGYRNGVVSSPNVAFNGDGAPASVSNANSFTFNSVYMTAAWNNGLDVLVQGYLNGTLLHSESFVLNTYTFPVRQFVFNWIGVDSVSFTSSDGIHQGNLIGFGEEIAFDNLTVSNVTPEPATLLLLGTGLTGIGAVIRRRRRRDIES